MTLAFGDAYRASGHVLWITALSAVAIALINLEVAYFNARHWLWYLPIFLLGCVATIAALPLADQNLRGYAGIYATGTMTLAIILFIPLIVMFNHDQNVPPSQNAHPVSGEGSLMRADAGSEGS